MENLKKICEEYFEKRKSFIENSWLSTFPILKRVFWVRSSRQIEMKKLRENDLNFNKESSAWLHVELSKHNYTEDDLSNFITFLEGHNLRVSGRHAFLLILAAILSISTIVSTKFPYFSIGLIVVIVIGFFALVERTDLNDLETGNKELILLLEREKEILKNKNV